MTKNPPSITQNSRKRITFGDEGPSNLQTDEVAFNPSFQSLLFDTNNNSNSPQSSRGTVSRATPFVKEEHDSPKNGVRKDVKLISDAAEPEELFGTHIQVLIGRFHGGFQQIEISGFLARTLDCGRVLCVFASQSEFLLSVTEKNTVDI